MVVNHFNNDDVVAREAMERFYSEEDGWSRERLFRPDLILIEWRKLASKHGRGIQRRRNGAPAKVAGARPNDNGSGVARFPSPDGQINAFVVKPAGAAPWPALILLHPVMGITPDIKDTAARFADKGYLVVVPDIYTHDTGFRKHTTADIDAAAHHRARRRGT